MIKNKKGFTLVEMLVVVAIIAILSSIFLVGLRGYRETAYDARRLSDLQKVQGNLELYYNKIGSYPSEADAPTWATFSDHIKSAGIGVTTVPSDPVSAQKYEYAVCSDGQGYILAAKLSVGAKAAADAALVDTTGCTPLPHCTQADKDLGWYCIKA